LTFKRRGNPHAGFGLLPLGPDSPAALTPLAHSGAHAARVLAAVDDPLGTIDFRSCVPDIFDQGQRGTCVSFAFKQALRGLQIHSGRQEVVSLSAGDNDYLCRLEDGNPDMAVDTGTTIRTAAHVISKYGFADEKFDTPYSDSALAVATKPSTSYLRLASDQSDIVGKTQSTIVPVSDTLVLRRAMSLAKNPCFLWAGMVSNSFARNEFDPSKPVDACPPGDIDGGHCMVGWSYYTAMGEILWWLSNSWGTDWGLGGWFVATTGFIESASELYIPTMITVGGTAST
jgi:hypothetical protein